MIFAILLGILAIVLLYQAFFALFAWVIRVEERYFYAKNPMVYLRMRVPKEDEDTVNTKGPMVMEQIFNTLHGTYKPISFWNRVVHGKANPRMSFEIAHLAGQIYFYAYVPKHYQKLIEGQMYAQYPEVEIEVVPDFIRESIEVSTTAFALEKPSKKKDLELLKKDPSLGLSFKAIDAGRICAAELTLMEPMIWPFKTYDFFVDKEDKTQVDTLSSITSAMSKLLHEEDQAWFQMVIRPERPLWQKYAGEGFDILIKGYFHKIKWFMKWFVTWYSSPYFWHHWLIKAPITTVMKMTWKMVGLLEPLERAATPVEKQEVGFTFWEIPKRKVSKLCFQTAVRVAYLSRSGNLPEARLKVEEMVSSFNQFQWPEVNGLEAEHILDSSTHRGQKLVSDIKDRVIRPGMVLAVDELASLFHLPMRVLETPNIAWVRAKRLEPPPDLPTPKEFPDLTLLGKTNYRGHHKIFGIKADDRRRHMYIIGKTGMGKSTVLENMIFDDIEKGRGVAVVDPHGELADKVTAMIPASRINDAIIFDPSDSHYPVSFNMLEVKSPEYRPLVASGLVGVFKKMYAESWGPRLEYILRNCIMALTEYEGATLLGIPRLLVDGLYREDVLKKVSDPVVKAFWVEEFAKMSDKLRTEAISPIQNKVGQFLSSPIIRNILGQPKSSIDIRHAMDTKKIFVVNLSKGKIGEDNSSLLGSMLITKFQLDAMSRADMDEKKRTDFYLYVDEFQNFATDSFATILSEARKYKLNLVMANQYVQQVEEEVMFAVFGNVGTLITFQVGFDDADYFSKQFAEVVTPADIISLPKYTTYIRLLVDNMPTKVFSAIMNPPVDVDLNSVIRKKVITSSRERFGTARDKVEKKIQEWSQSIASPEVKKALEAKSGGLGGSGVRWRYDRNKAEFEELIASAGKKFKVLDRKDFEKYGVKDAVNELVYVIPEENILIYSRIDNQGNSFNRKESAIDCYHFDKKDPLQQELIAPVVKEPGWQLGLNKAIGGGFRSPKNKEEMENAFTKADYTFEVVDRKIFPDIGFEKALNELVYRLKKGTSPPGPLSLAGEGEIIVVSALDPQGGCFTKNPDQVIRIGTSKDKKFQEKKKVKKSITWIEEVEKSLKT